MNKLLKILMIMPLLSLAAGGAWAAGEPLKVVYHVADEDKVGFALANIRNHIQGVGGPENVEIVLVTHGPAVKGFTDIDALDAVRNGVASLAEQGVKFQACANALEVFGLEADELLPAFTIAEEGGVTRIAALQSQGYVYIRP